MYIRKQTLIIGGIIIVGFVVGNIALMIKEKKEGKKTGLRSIVELAREAKNMYGNAY